MALPGTPGISFAPQGFHEIKDVMEHHASQFREQRMSFERVPPSEEVEKSHFLRNTSFRRASAVLLGTPRIPCASQVFHRHDGMCGDGVEKARRNRSPVERTVAATMFGKMANVTELFPRRPPRLRPLPPASKRFTRLYTVGITRPSELRRFRAHLSAPR